jgi:hypothetical protein
MSPSPRSTWRHSARVLKAPGVLDAASHHGAGEREGAGSRTWRSGCGSLGIHAR